MLAVTLLVIVACTPQSSDDRIKKPQDFCNTDADCACGRHIETGACFFGNKDYVDTTQQCPDFCTGITGAMKLQCVNNSCEQMLHQE